ncbi:MAG: hypothetical protein JSV78_13520 [Phycisphaerales bacterium]|nr:MAG: hypothetical protein JSV78_13520 [Phycisphaerales bacterium]
MRNSRWQVLGGSVCLLLVSLGGCETGGKTGALAGSGIGALAGQAIGRDTKSTLIGAGVGAGVGYMIGNEKDKEHAKEMNQESKAHNYTHTEVKPLGGTRWLLVDIAPKSGIPPYASKVVEFRPYGRVITTTTNPDGSVDVTDERYRVVGNALVINKPDLLINAQYDISGDEMIVSAENFRAVLKRMR